MIHRLGRTKVLVAALLLAICLVFQNSGSAFARAPGNDFEWHVKYGGSDAIIGKNPYCSATYTGNVGSIWLSDSRNNVFGTPMSASGGGAGVTIRAKYSDMDTGVLVYIFGSVYGCHTGGSYNTAKNLRDDAGYLTNLSGTELHRGTSRVNDFSDPGAPLTARLQINRIHILTQMTLTIPQRRAQLSPLNCIAVSAGPRYLIQTVRRLGYRFALFWKVLLGRLMGSQKLAPINKTGKLVRTL